MSLCSLEPYWTPVFRILFIPAARIQIRFMQRVRVALFMFVTEKKVLKKSFSISGRIRISYSRNQIRIQIKINRIRNTTIGIYNYKRKEAFIIFLYLIIW